MPTLLTAGGLTVGAQIVSATDGAITIQSGPDGSKVDSAVIDASGVVTLPKSNMAPGLITIGASVAANALTITMEPTTLTFRSATLGSGATTVLRNTSTLSLTISSGSTLGTVNAIQSDIVVLAINNGGTVELAAVNISGGNDLSETNLISTTAEGGAGAADSANVIYSTTARTNVPYKVVGLVRSTQATAGTWATAPSLIQGAGGAALESMGSLGYGQTWSSPARSAGVTYYNSTGKPIVVNVSTSTGTGSLTPVVSGFSLPIGTLAGTIRVALSFVVPAGASYSVTDTGAGIQQWSELR